MFLENDPMNIVKSPTLQLTGLHGKPITFDYRHTSAEAKQPLVLFVHGFKGFKDWGYFNIMADFFAQNGFAFLKMNFSHNGTTPNSLTDFADLDAFGNNNFIKELDDMKVMVDHIHSNQFELSDKIDMSKIYLIGHSRGGGVALLKTSEDDRIKAVSTLAAVADIRKVYTEDIIEKWKEEGVLYIENSRTKQQMPLYYQLVENTLNNEDRLNIPEAVRKLKKPLFITHGTNDETLPVTMAKALHHWKPDSKLCIIDGADHTFGGSHPYTKETLPVHAKSVLKEIVAFFKSV